MEENRQNCAVLGGDARQARLCDLLVQDGWQVRAFGLGETPWSCPDPAQALEGARWAALPMPAEKEGMLNGPLAEEPLPIDYLLEQIRQAAPGCLLLAGLPSPALCRLAEEKGLRLRDYGTEESLVRRNAAITAEAALGLAMEQRQRTILGSPCLVIGYGRIGRALAWRLRALGARTTVTARKPEDLVQAQCDGLSAVALEHLADVLPRQQLLFNTAPALILDRSRLALLSPEALVIDLASNPGGSGLPRRVARARRPCPVLAWRWDVPWWPQGRSRGCDGHTPCQLLGGGMIPWWPQDGSRRCDGHAPCRLGGEISLGGCLGAFIEVGGSSGIVSPYPG